MEQTEKKQFFIDIDKAIEVQNEANPENKIDRKILAEKLGIAYQSLTNYKAGRIPEIIGNVQTIIEITGISFDELVKIKN